MNLRDAFAEALRLLRAHRLRSSLTMFGLVWGTASVVLLVSWGDGVAQMVDRGFARAGRNMGQFWAGRIGEEFSPAVDRRELRFTWDDLHAVRRQARLADLVAGEARRYVTATYRQRSRNVDLRGVEPEGAAIRGPRVASGRAIARADLDHRRRIVVLGNTLHRELLGAGGGIGSWVRIEGTPFRVVGIHERVGTQLMNDGDPLDKQAWIPITTAMSIWPHPGTDDWIVAAVLYRMRSPELYDATRDELRALLARRLRVSASDREAIVGFSAVEMLRTLPIAQLGAVMFLLSAATLAIGGLGTLNLLLDSVRERRGEIGVRLAVGARPRDILLQFGLESIAVVVLGGGLGLALGVAGCLALASLDLPDLIPVPRLTFGIVALAIGVLGAVAICAATVPAWRAAQVDPAESVRGT